LSLFLSLTQGIAYCHLFFFCFFSFTFGRLELGLLEVEVKGMVIDDEENVSEYHQINDQLARMKESIRSVVTEPIHVLQFLKPGRLVRVRDGDSDYGWGAVINFTKRANENNKTGKSGIQLSATKYIVDVLLPCAPGTGKNPPRPCPAGEKPEAVVVPVLLSLLDGVSSLCVYLPKDLRPADNRQGVLRSVEEISRFDTMSFSGLSSLHD
jgi:ATP-dependent RNA helicase DOB1